MKCNHCGAMRAAEAGLRLGGVVLPLVVPPPGPCCDGLVLPSAINCTLEGSAHDGTYSLDYGPSPIPGEYDCWTNNTLDLNSPHGVGLDFACRPYGDGLYFTLRYPVVPLFNPDVRIQLPDAKTCDPFSVTYYLLGTSAGITATISMP